MLCNNIVFCSCVFNFIHMCVCACCLKVTQKDHVAEADVLENIGKEHLKGREEERRNAELLQRDMQSEEEKELDKTNDLVRNVLL